MAQKRKRPAPVAVLDPKHTHFKEIAPRRVRPRPLHYEEKLRVLWPDDPELAKIDGGAFLRWLKDTEAAKERGELPAGAYQAEVVIVGNTSSIPTKPASHAPQPAALACGDLPSGKPCGQAIQVPKFRLLPKRERVVHHAEEAVKASFSGGEPAYIRHRQQTQDELDARIEYDLDSDDENWLANRNKKGKVDPLCEADLERLIDGFEKAKQAVLRQSQASWSLGDAGGHATPLEERSPSEVYPVAQALEDFGDEFPSLTVRAVHNYWAKKAGDSKLPLLQRFWYDKPWARVLARTARKEAESDSDSDDGIPFQGKDDAAPQRRPRGRKRNLDLEEVEDRLHAARGDLERLRTIADQVRRREKIKKRLLQEWRTELWERAVLARQPRTKGRWRAKGLPKSKAGKSLASVTASARRNGTTAAAALGNREAAAVAAESGDLTISRRASLGGSIVSAVVDQLRRLGGWGAKPVNGAAALGHDPALAALESPAEPVSPDQEHARMTEAGLAAGQEQPKKKHVRFAKAARPAWPRKRGASVREQPADGVLVAPTRGLRSARSGSQQASAVQWGSSLKLTGKPKRGKPGEARDIALVETRSKRRTPAPKAARTAAVPSTRGKGRARAVEGVDESASGQPGRATRARPGRGGAARLAEPQAKRLTRNSVREGSATGKQQTGQPQANVEIVFLVESESETHSSGSDTYIPAESEEASSEEEHTSQAPRRQQPPSHRGMTRLTRQSSGPARDVSVFLPKVPLEWKRRAACEAPSDASSFSEGSGPSLFRQSGEDATGPRRLLRSEQNKSKAAVTQKKKGRLVAAARQRVRRATRNSGY